MITKGGKKKNKYKNNNTETKQKIKKTTTNLINIKTTQKQNKQSTKPQLTNNPFSY
jgi:hypothetical protein